MSKMKSDQPVRALMVIPSFSPTIGGAETQLLGLGPHLEGLNAVYAVATRRIPGTSKADEVAAMEVHRLPASPYPFAFLFALAAFMWRHRRNYAVIHSHTMNSPVWVCAIVGALLNKPVVAKITRSGTTGLVAIYQKNLFRRFLFARLWRLVSVFVALTSEIAGELRSAGVPGNRIIVLPNGVKPEETGTMVVPLERRVFIAYVGRLILRKRVDWLLQAFAESGLSSGFRLKIAGDGPDGARLARLASELGIVEAVDFLGQCDRGQVRDLLASARVFVLPSTSEGMSNAVLEAMASGVPVIATDMSANRQILDDKREGLLFRDLADLKEKLVLLCHDEAKAREIAKAARQRVACEYDFSHIATRYSDLYKELVR